MVAKVILAVGKDLYIDYLNCFIMKYIYQSISLNLEENLKYSSRQNYVQFKDVTLTISIKMLMKLQCNTVINWKNTIKT